MEVISKFNLSSIVYGSIILLSVLLVSTTFTQDVNALEMFVIRPSGDLSNLNQLPTKLTHRTTQIIVADDSGQQVIYTQREKLFEALSDNGYDLSSGMVSEPHRFTKLNGGTVRVALKNSKIPVKIIEDNHSYTITTSSNTVQNILLSCHIDLGPKDKVFPALEKQISANSTIYIDRATPLKITYGKNSYEMETHAKNIAEAVTEAKKELQIPDDQINEVLLSSKDELHSGQEIKVTRITTEKLIEQADIFPDTIYEDDWDSPLGVENVLDWGQNGTKELVYEVNFEDGIETSRSLVAESTIKEPQPKKVAIGKKQPEIIFTAPATGGTVGTASWYSYGSTPTCAHRDYPKGTQLLVTNNATGASIVVTVNDYGPQAWTGRIIDLNSVAFSAIAPLSQGLMEVTVTPI